MKTVIVTAIPKCDICNHLEIIPAKDAKYDAPTTFGTQWGYLCEDHVKTHGRNVEIGSRLMSQAEANQTAAARRVSEKS